MNEIRTTADYLEHLKSVKEQALVRLVQIRKAIQELQREEEQIKDWALDYATELLAGEKTGNFEVDGIRVSISINYKRTFEYPDEIKKAEEELKKAKKKAELDGSAKLISLNPYLVFKF